MLFSLQDVFCRVRDTKRIRFAYTAEVTYFVLRCNEVLVHVHILDDRTHLCDDEEECRRNKHAILRMMKVPLKQFYLEYCYSRTKYVRMCVCIYSSCFDVKEQLVDDGIKRYQATNYHGFG